MKPIAIVVALAGCATNLNSSGFAIDGAVAGSAPQTGTVAVLWTVTSTSPDYTYKFGDGPATSTSYMVTLDTDPPAAAINANGLALGSVALFPAETQIADGTFNATQYPVTGYSREYAIIWKDPTKPGLGTWDTSFGARYSCARCIKATTSGTFDSFQLAPCANVVIDLTSTFVCNAS